MQNNIKPVEETAPCCKMNGERPCFEENDKVKPENFAENVQKTEVNETSKNEQTDSEAIDQEQEQKLEN